MPAAADDAAVVRPTTDFSKAENFEKLSGGAATSRKKVNASAFSHPSANMDFDRRLDFEIGDGFFRRVWVSAPSSTKAADGLGPLYNAKSCQRCHLKDGRGHPPAANRPNDNAVSMFLRLSIPPQAEADRVALSSGRIAVVSDPVYGGQLQDFAIQGHKAEGRMNITYTERQVLLSDGATVSLRVPTYAVVDLANGPLHKNVMISPRVANPMIGLGLLEAIDANVIRGLADPTDKDGNGISGRVNESWSPSRDRIMLGRFGWKAGNPTVEDQTTAAFLGDIGISTPAHPTGSGECTPAQTACRTAPHGGETSNDGVEATRQVVDFVTFYARNLAVPQRRDVNDPSVLRGKRAFYEAGCTGCHTPKFITPRNIAGMPEQSRQLIWPYTDLLLHDMGEGLADNRPEGRATGREWRTPPLWGIGLTKTVSGHTHFLHDGRARNLLEAILWHGGEAAAAKQNVVEMSPETRADLLKFLNSL